MAFPNTGIRKATFSNILLVSFLHFTDKNDSYSEALWHWFDQAIAGTMKLVQYR